MPVGVLHRRAGDRGASVSTVGVPSLLLGFSEQKEGFGRRHLFVSQTPLRTEPVTLPVRLESNAEADIGDGILGLETTVALCKIKTGYRKQDPAQF